MWGLFHTYVQFRADLQKTQDIRNRNAASDSVRPKPGYGIGNQNQGPISVLVSELIFFLQIFKFS
jgi:hypothetical protein